MKLGLYHKIIVMIIIAELAGGFGGIFTAPAIGEWYLSLAKPEWTPPSWVFASAWTILYALMGIAAGLIWHEKSKKKTLALKIYGVQLVLNVAWSLLFFGLRSPAYALAEIALLWLAIAAAIALFHKISKKAAYLMVPYILWVTFAAFLNYGVWVLNA